MTASIRADGECLACGSHDTQFSFKSRERDASFCGYEYWACKSCASLFLNPRPDQQTLDDMYAQDAFSSGRSVKVSVERYLAHERFNADHRQYIVPLLEHRQKGQFLDFGCGHGWLTHQAALAGFDAVGIDLNAPAIEAARDLLKGEFHVGGIDYVESLPAASLDVVAAASSLEHVREPGRMLSEFRRVLAPGGLLMAVVPTIDSLQYKHLGEYYYWAMAPYHITLFSREGLTALFRQHGFSVSSVTEIHRNWYWTKALAEKIGKRDAYLKLRENPEFVALDIAIDGLLDDIASDAGQSSAILVFAEAKT